MELARDEFNPDKGRLTWTAQWFGKTLPNRLVPTESIIEVVLKAEDNLGRPIFHTAKVGAGSFCSVTLGSRWRDGKRLGDPDWLDRFAGEVDFIADAQPVDAWAELPGSVEAARRYLIPKFRHSIPISTANSPCYIFPFMRGKGRFIVPAAEIVRTCYLRGTITTHALMCGSIGDAISAMIDEQATQESEAREKPVIHLKEGMGDSDALLAIMLWKCNLAKKNYGAMLGNLRANAANFKTTYLRALPPFSGPHKVKARGIAWEQEGIPYFLALRLTSIPYPEIVGPVTYSLQRVEAEFVEEPGPGGGPRKPRRKQHAPRRRNLKHDNEPNGNLSPHIADADLPEWVGLPLLLKSIRVKTVQAHREVSKKAEPNPNSEHSSGQGCGTGTVIPARFRDRIPEGVTLPPNFNSLVAASNNLNSRIDTEAIFVTSQGEPTLIGQPPFCEFSWTQKQKAWPYIEGRQRRAMVLRIKTRQSFFYAVEIERRSKNDEYATCIAQMREPKTDLPLLLRKIVDHAGRNLHNIDGFFSTKIKHRHKSAGDFATSLLLACEHLKLGGRASPAAATGRSVTAQ